MKDEAGILTLSALCKELKLDPRLARMQLREAVKDTKTYPHLAGEHKPRLPWAWAPGSKALADARKALKAIAPKS